MQIHVQLDTWLQLAAGSGGEDILFPGLLPPGERLTAASRFSQNTQSHTRTEDLGKLHTRCDTAGGSSEKVPLSPRTLSF